MEKIGKGFTAGKENANSMFQPTMITNKHEKMIAEAEDILIRLEHNMAKGIRSEDTDAQIKKLTEFTLAARRQEGLDRSTEGNLFKQTDKLGQFAATKQFEDFERGLKELRKANDEQKRLEGLKGGLDKNLPAAEALFRNLQDSVGKPIAEQKAVIEANSGALKNLTDRINNIIIVFCYANSYT